MRILRDAASAPQRQRALSPTGVRIVSLNVFSSNRAHGRVIEFVRHCQPDVLALVEVTSEWRRALHVLGGLFPHLHLADEEGRRSVLLLSRWPIVEITTVSLGRGAQPALMATLETCGRSWCVIAAHTTWPVGWANAMLRNRQLAQIGALARAAPGPVAVVGDLNVTPLSSHFQSLLDQGGLRSAADGFGRRATWPAFLPVLGIQIDHCLVSAGVEVRCFRCGPYVGSDHRPIIVDLSV